ncbi:3-oxoacyl-ACP synthase, partial [Streptomyces sp. NPDC059142]
TAPRPTPAPAARRSRGVRGAPPPPPSDRGGRRHSLAAAGAIEAVATALTLEEGHIPPTANLESLDPELELDMVFKAGRDVRAEVAVSNSFGFGGQNAVLLFTAA